MISNISIVEQQEAFNDIYNYSIGNDVDIHPRVHTHIKIALSSKEKTAAYREEIVARALGYQHLNRLHGFDAKDNIRNEFIEIKTEQADSIQKSEIARHCQLVGYGNFGEIKNCDIQSKFIESPFLINHGYFLDGKLLAILNSHPLIQVLLRR